MFASVQSALGETLTAITAVSLETIAIGGIVVGLVFYGLHFGKFRLTAIILGFFATWPLYALFPYRDALPTIGSAATTDIVLFLIILVATTMLIGRVTRGAFSLSRTRRLGEAALLAVAVFALAGVSFYHVIPGSDVYALTDPYITSLLSVPHAQFWAAAAALAVLAFTSRSQVVV